VIASVQNMHCMVLCNIIGVRGQPKNTGKRDLDWVLNTAEGRWRHDTELDRDKQPVFYW